MFATRRAQFGSFVALAADASLTMLSDRVHRGSLANARQALDERRVAELGSAPAMHGRQAPTPLRRTELGQVASG